MYYPGIMSRLDSEPARRNYVEHMSIITHDIGLELRDSTLSRDPA